MAVISKVLARTSASTLTTSLYTTPAGTTAVITNIVICNTSTSSATATILLNNVDLLNNVTIAANSSAFFDLKQVLPATELIAGSASTVAVDFHISGVEIN